MTRHKLHIMTILAHYIIESLIHFILRGAVTIWRASREIMWCWGKSTSKTKLEITTLERKIEIFLKLDLSFSWDEFNRQFRENLFNSWTFLINFCIVKPKDGLDYMITFWFNNNAKF